MTWLERLDHLHEQADRERGFDRDGYVTRIEEGKWCTAYISSFSPKLLRACLAGTYGPLRPEEREAAELTLAMRVMAKAARK